MSMDTMRERTFASFSADAWAAWIEAVLAGAPTIPALPNTNREIDQELLTIFRSLEPVPGTAFAAAVGTLVKSTPLTSRFAQRLFTLLQLVATVKPRGLDVYLDRVLRDEVCRGLQYGRGDLHSDVLSTLSRYGVDERLIDYIEESAIESASFPYVLNGFRVAVMSSAAAAARIAPYVADLVLRDQRELRSRQFSVQLLELALHHKLRDFLSFLLDVSEQGHDLRTEVVGAAMLASGAATQEARSTTLAVFSKVIITACRATVERVSLQDVLDVARSHNELKYPVALRVLEHIWRCGARFMRGPVPWEYVAHNDDYIDERLMTKNDVLFNSEKDNVAFEKKADPRVAELLGTVSNAPRQRTASLAAAPVSA